MNETIMDFLLTRTSVPVQDLKAPGPDDAQIAKIIAAASRVPDHGKLAPWRFIIYRGEASEEVGRRLVALAEELEGPLPEGRRMKEQTRFSRAPVVIGVVSTPRHHPSIPDWEKFLSGGMAAMNLMIAANALGFGTNLITNWYSDSPEGRAVLGLAPDERVVGFVHIGSFDEPVQDRPRPDPATLYADYTGPWQG